MDILGHGAQQSDRVAKPKSSTKQLELHVASVYTEIAEMIQEVKFPSFRKEISK